MRCETALERLLDGEGPRVDEAPDLAGHLSDCTRCRATADRIGQSLEGLALELDATVGPFAEAEAVRLASADRARAPKRRVVWAFPRLHSRWNWGPAVALVAITALIWVSNRAPTAADAWSPNDPTADIEPVLSVQAPEGARMAVFQTQNPKISVVWLY